MSDRRGARVGVVGGGLAGIAAALHCADAGRVVNMWEAAARLGGLTYSFRRHGMDVDNGQHVFLRCCTAYRALLARLEVTEQVALQPRLDIPVHWQPGMEPAGSSGRSGEPTWSARPARLRRTNLPAPLHLAGALARYAPLSPAERLAFARAALALRRVDGADAAVDEQSFGGWLAAHGQSGRAVRNLWDLVGVATLNATAENTSLGLAATVFQTGLLTDATAADLGWSLVPLSRLHADPAHRQLDAVGVRVHTGAKVEAIAPRGDSWVLRSGGSEHVVDQVIVAVGPLAAQRLLPPGSVMAPDGWARLLGSSPIVNVHAVYDRPVMAGALLAAAGSPALWIFDRTRQAGLREGQYLAVSISAAYDLIGLPTAFVRAQVLPVLAALLPATRSAHLRDFFVTRERHATFRPAPGSARLRPGPTTAHDGLFLAGAWTATGWPDTMEGAVRSGEAAARALLAAGFRPVERVPA